VRVVDLLTLAVAAGTVAGLKAVDRATQPEDDRPLRIVPYQPSGRPPGCWRNVRGGNPCGEPAVGGSGLCGRHVEEMRQW
jgi:hypothetical protein